MGEPVMTCAMEDCLTPAGATVHAQWSVADWIEYEMCLAHIDEAIAALERRTVDGQLPVDVWVTHYSRES